MNKKQSIFNKHNNHCDFLVILFWGGYLTRHNERYDLNGRKISEPLYVSLKKFGFTINNDEVIVYKEEELS